MNKRQRQDAHHQEVVSAYYQTGEEGPLGPVLAEVRIRLLALARGTFGVLNQERAEDLAQEAIAYLLNSLRAKKYEPIGTLTAYAGTHLRFLFLNSLRHKPSDPGRHEDPFLLVSTTHATEPDELRSEDEAQAATTVAAATRAVLGLDPGARAAVLLHYYQGLPEAQAAAQLGISETAFGARLQRGLATLRQWAATTARPTAEVYAALARLDTGSLFSEPLRMAG